MDIPERRLSTAEVQELSLHLQNDLIAIFGVIGDAADRLLDKAVSEGWTPEVLIDEIVRLIDGDNRAPETVAMPKVGELKVNKSRLQTLRVLEKSLETLAVMKAGKPVGTISERADGRYRKTELGEWEKVTEPKTDTPSSNDLAKDTRKTLLTDTRTLATNSSPEESKKSIAAFYSDKPENIELVPVNDGLFRIQKKGSGKIIDGLQVRLQNGRYRFEMGKMQSDTDPGKKEKQENTMEPKNTIKVNIKDMKEGDTIYQKGKGGLKGVITQRGSDWVKVKNAKGEVETYPISSFDFMTGLEITREEK